METLFFDQNLLGVARYLENKGTKVRDITEILGHKDTRQGVPDDSIIDHLRDKSSLILVTKDKGLARKAREHNIKVILIDETEVLATEVLCRIAARVHTIDVESIIESLQSFSSGYRSRKYDEQFNDFWVWKNHVEKTESILDETHIDETWNRLRKILGGWQTYRGTRNEYPYRDLKKSLIDVAESIKVLNEFSFLDFWKIPTESLEDIWNALGRVKEPEGKTNEEGRYFVIAVCKPLMLLWGQTLAFDQRVRFSLPRQFDVSMEDRKWTFSKWHSVMTSITKWVKNQPDLVTFLEEESARRYGEQMKIPYGRFLDIHFFEK
ncbi:MAG: hypothetical protein NWE88_01830 [Candidatus Bathyarchaeota archaeon]|nr:hypothetical protein [Candidatus Bathyarchaeota archaeon]